MFFKVETADFQQLPKEKCCEALDFFSFLLWLIMFFTSSTTGSSRTRFATGSAFKVCSGLTFLLDLLFTTILQIIDVFFYVYIAKNQSTSRFHKNLISLKKPRLILLILMVMNLTMKEKKGKEKNILR